MHCMLSTSGIQYVLSARVRFSYAPVVMIELVIE
jgi:hypothetical protein